MIKHCSEGENVNLIPIKVGLTIKFNSNKIKCKRFLKEEMNE